MSRAYPYFEGRCVLTYDYEASRILGGDCWRRLETHRFMLSERQWLATPAGGLTDKGSIPRPAWPIVPRDGEFEIAFDMHDQGCEYLSLTVDGKPYRVSRERIDSLLYVAMEVLGGTEREIAPVRAAVEAHRRVLNVTEPSNTALKRELESKWVTGIGLLAANPAMQGLRCAADFRRDGLNGRPLGRIVVQVFQNHAHGTFTDFRGVGRSLSHGLIFSRVEASTKPGAIHW